MGDTPDKVWWQSVSQNVGISKAALGEGRGPWRDCSRSVRPAAMDAWPRPADRPIGQRTARCPGCRQMLTLDAAHSSGSPPVY